jgi:hypothetical protein
MTEDNSEGYCEKKDENSPDCAKCSEFTIEDIREDVAASCGEGDFSSFCFRVFHRDPETRGMWRRKVCKHFRTG